MATNDSLFKKLDTCCNLFLRSAKLSGVGRKWIGIRLFLTSGPGFSASFTPQVASDLTQETLIRLVKKCEDGSYDSTQGSIVMFSYGIARLVRLEAWKNIPPEDSFSDPKDYDGRIETPAFDGHEDEAIDLIQ